MKTRLLFLAAILALVSSTAFAGFIQPQSVLIDEANGFAQGDQWTARSSDNDVEFIGCGIRVFAGGFQFGFCQARDADGNSVTCNTTDADLLEAMQSGNDLSFITFSFAENEDGGIDCTRIGFSTQSFYLPLFETEEVDDEVDDD